MDCGAEIRVAIDVDQRARTATVDFTGTSAQLANSQGTMNNFTFGNAAYQYYETLCGGAGAGHGFAGASAVHTHMTNSRLTDVEVLERRFPVTVEEFSVRNGSGGHGRWGGGAFGAGVTGNA
jgi:5-oxoprolinase (ATP-hydrolysing)